MRFWIYIAPTLLACSAFAQQQQPAPSPSCVTGTCQVSPKDQKRAQQLFKEGLKLQSKSRLDESLQKFEEAADLVPQNVDYATARELLKQQVISQHLQKGNERLLASKNVEALAEFRTAMHLDPGNEFALQRLKDAMGEWTPPITKTPPRVIAAAGPVDLVPRPGQQEFHFRGDTRGLLMQVSQAFGITLMIDDSVQSRQVNFQLGKADFFTAIQAACDVSKTFWTPLEEKQILVAADTPDNRRSFIRMGYRTFYLGDASTPQDFTDLSNLLRSVFEVRLVSAQPNNGTLTVRAPQPMLEAVSRFLDDFDQSRPQVLLEINIYQVDHRYLRQMGLNLPTQFSLFNIPASALQLAGGQNIQDLINQLIASGGINAANSTALSALLAQLQNQQNSIFSQPLATFGGGKTLMGLTLGTLASSLSLNTSDVTTLERATLRAGQGNAATMRIGSRYPILNAQFAPIFNTPAISRVIANNSFRPAFPSFNYEDLGVNLKAKPAIHGSGDISLELEVSIRSLSGQSLNGVPVINNREYKGQIQVKEGEPAVVAGYITKTETKSTSGYPVLAQTPVLRNVAASNSKEDDQSELLVVITPHLARAPEHSSGDEIWLPASR